MEATLEQHRLDACRRGRAVAYRPLVEAYFARAVRLAGALIGDHGDAEDLAQEAFIAAYRAMPTHQPGRPFYPWLRGILINRAKVFVRSRSRSRARREAVAQRPGHWAVSGTAAAPSGHTDVVSCALSSLSADDRALLVLKHVEGYTYGELSAQLGVPSGTVMSRLYRARQRMRQHLEQLDPGLIQAGPELGEKQDA